MQQSYDAEQLGKQVLALQTLVHALSRKVASLEARLIASSKAPLDAHASDQRMDTSHDAP